MLQDEKKQAAAQAALKHLPKGDFRRRYRQCCEFLIELAELQLEAAVASSEATTCFA